MSIRIEKGSSAYMDVIEKYFDDKIIRDIDRSRKYLSKVKSIDTIKETFA